MMRWLRRWILALSLLMTSAGAWAQTPTAEQLTARLDVPAARDMIDATRLGITLDIPAVPADFVRITHGPLTIVYPPRIDPLVRATLEHAEEDARAVARQLGLTELPAIEVRLVSDVESMRALAPRNAPPPNYAVGVAYPSARLALVSASSPVTREASNMRQVLRHELSHVLLGAATADGPVPRWLAEGIAVEQAGEHSMERFEELALASFTGRMLPLRRLDSAFSSGPSDVNVAYAQSADFVGYLLKSEGVGRFAVMLSHIREGMSLEDSVRETYGVTLTHIEDEWRRDASSRFALAPLWAGTSAAWMLGAAALVIGAIRRKRKSRETLDRWAREDRRRANVAFTLFRPGSLSHRMPTLSTREAGGVEDEAEVPRIALDGEKHTLH